MVIVSEPRPDPGRLAFGRWRPVRLPRLQAKQSESQLNQIQASKRRPKTLKKAIQVAGVELMQPASHLTLPRPQQSAHPHRRTFAETEWRVIGYVHAPARGVVHRGLQRKRQEGVATAGRHRRRVRRSWDDGFRMCFPWGLFVCGHTVPGRNLSSSSLS